MMWILINTTRPTGVEGAGGPGCGARGRQRGLAGQRADAQSHTSAHQAPQVWRAPEGPGARASLQTRGLAAVPVGGGRARAGLEIDHSEPSGSRVAISRAGRRPPAHTAARPIKASHAAPGTPAGPQATSNKQRTQKRPPGTGWAYLSRLWESNPRPIHYE